MILYTKVVSTEYGRRYRSEGAWRRNGDNVLIVHETHREKGPTRRGARPVNVPRSGAAPAVINQSTVIMESQQPHLKDSRTGHLEPDNIGKIVHIMVILLYIDN